VAGWGRRGRGGGISAKLDSDYSDGGRRRGGVHLFGWIVIGLLAALVVGSLTLWGIGLATGRTPFFFAGGHPFFFFFPFGFVFFLIFVFFVARLLFWGGGAWWGWRGRGYRSRYYYWGDAREILRQRYARGEITKEQFEQMNRDLDERK
jgi:putative membrane protein